MSSLDKKLIEREERRKHLFQTLHNCDRRTFLKLSGKFAAMAAAAGVIAPHSFQLVEFVHAATTPGATPEVAFRFAYISDTHLFNKGLITASRRAPFRAEKTLIAPNPQPISG